MKTLQDQTLLYDEDCPMCNLYTAGFIKAKMLDANGRRPFANITNEEEHYIDLNRAKNEIALVDTKNKTVLYGIDSLLKVLGFSFPMIEKIGNWKPVNDFLKKLYKFISYNRKVIIPSKVNKDMKFDCTPDFNYQYRMLYIVFATVFTAIVLYYYSKNIPFLPEGTWTREILLATGQIGFQCIFIQKLSKEKKINYIGNLVTISLMGSLILVPILVLKTLLNNQFILTWFSITVFIMVAEHFRRVQLLELPKYLTLTWIIYRIIALVIILNL